MWRMINKPERRNFYIQNGVAYTEDRIPIRRITWCCEYPVGKAAVARHFGNYGPVTDVTYDHRYQCGQMLFMTVCGAARALYNQLHIVKGRGVNLMASASRDQPQDGGGTISGYDLAVSDDVLRKVVVYLPLRSRLTFAATCQRFKEIYKLESKKCNKVLDLAEVAELTEWGLTELMRLSGPHIEKIQGGPLPMRWPHMKLLVTLLGPSCPALKGVELIEVRLTSFYLTNLFERSQGIRYITELTLRRCGVMDRDLLSLSALPTIYTLDLWGNTGISGTTLHTLPPVLAVLVLSRCPNLKALNLQRLGTRPQLRELRCSIIMYRNIHIDWIEDDDPNYFEEVYKPLLPTCPKLETLEVTVCPYEDGEEIANFPELKSLTLVPLPVEPEPYSVKETLMRALAEKNMLEHLKLGYANPSFVDIASLRAITRLTRLRTLTLPNQEFSDLDWGALAKLSDLRYLNVSGSANLSNTTVAYLVAKLRRLKVLKVKRCPRITAEVFPLLLDLLASRRSDWSDVFLAKSLVLDVSFTNIEENEIPESRLLKVVI